MHYDCLKRELITRRETVIIEELPRCTVRTPFLIVWAKSLAMKMSQHTAAIPLPAMPASMSFYANYTSFTPAIMW
jgi:hypothetical protein